MAFQPWKVFGEAVSCIAYHASMWPWLFSHGKLPSLSPGRRPPSRFNVAMAFQPWKEFYLDGHLYPQNLLQCGHGFSAMESRRLRIREWPDRPLQCGHGFSAMERPVTEATFAIDCSLQCGHGFSAMESLLMKETSFAPMTLQCGHGFSAMERRDYGRSPSRALDASMWPWLFSHGKNISRTPAVLQPHSIRLASMWPWLFSHGKFIVGAGGAYAVGLQCGHGFSAMESTQLDVAVSALSVASMWPWLFSHGKS